MSVAAWDFLFFITFAASTFHISYATKTIVVAWGIPLDPDLPYPDHNVQVGDTVIFKWGQSVPNNVYIHPTGTCEQDDRIFVGDSFVGTSHSFKEEDVGDLFFTSDVPGQCEAGQFIKFIVSTSDVSTSYLLVDTTGVQSMSTYFDFIMELWDGVEAQLPDTLGSPYVFEDDPATDVILFPLPDIDATDLPIWEDADPMGILGDGSDPMDVTGVGSDQEEVIDDDRGFVSKIIRFVVCIVTLPIRLFLTGVTALFD